VRGTGLPFGSSPWVSAEGKGAQARCRQESGGDQIPRGGGKILSNLEITKPCKKTKGDLGERNKCQQCSPSVCPGGNVWHVAKVGKETGKTRYVLETVL